MGTANDNSRLPVAPPAPSLYDGADFARLRFVGHVAAQGFVHLSHATFRGAIDAAAAAALGRAELVRVKSDGAELEAFVWLAGGLACLVDACYGAITVEVAGHDPDAISAAVAGVRERLHRPDPPPSTVPFAFWSAAPRGGGAVRHRDVEVAEWSAARPNYTARVARALDALTEVREPRRARLLVWRGPPGTGKTWALRALAGAWRDWCTAHYVLDPHTLLGADPRYLLDVLAWKADDGAPTWRLLVLEDAGELIVHDAGRSGALAALLNITDGILGQGSGTIVLVTTNEPVEHVHPAARRRGRCLADIEFGPLSRAEATAWLRRAGSPSEPEGPLTLGELYALADGGEDGDEPVPATSAFGFSRALGS